MQSWFWTELDFNDATVVLVQPLAYNHFVHSYATVSSLLQSFLQDLQFSPLFILQLKQNITGTDTSNKQDEKAHAEKCVTELVALKMNEKKILFKKFLFCELAIFITQ